jgi:hypothetical protein
VTLPGRALVLGLARAGQAAVVASGEANAEIERALGPAETARLREILRLLGE